MRVRNLDRTGDWSFGQSQSNYVKDAYAVVLDLKMRLREWYGDCFFALQNGIPWAERLGSHNQKELLDNDILTVVQETQGVLNVFNFESSTDGRRYRCKFEVYTQYSADTLPVEFDSERMS